MKILLSIPLLFIGFLAQGQFIQQITVLPAQPSVSDSVLVLVQSAFSSGSCDESSQNLGPITPFYHQADAVHCLGILSVICYDTDTFQLGLLPAGQHTCVVTIHNGFLPAPCSPVIQPGVRDSIKFTVSTAAGLDQVATAAFSVSPNPAQESIYIKQGSRSSTGGHFVIYDGLGKPVLTLSGDHTGGLDISALSAGIYWIRFVADGEISRCVKFIKQ